MLILNYGQVAATLTTDPDGALWVAVEGTDIEQLATKISVVCDAMNSHQPPDSVIPFIAG